MNIEVKNSIGLLPKPFPELVLPNPESSKNNFPIECEKTKHLICTLSSPVTSRLYRSLEEAAKTSAQKVWTPKTYLNIPKQHHLTSRKKCHCIHYTSSNSSNPSMSELILFPFPTPNPSRRGILASLGHHLIHPMR